MVKVSLTNQEGVVLVDATALGESLSLSEDERQRLVAAKVVY